MRYEDIINGLDISEVFLNEHQEPIADRLATAGKTIEESQKKRGLKNRSSLIRQADFSGICDSLNLAKTVLILACSDEKIDQVIDRVQHDSTLCEQDPLTVIISSVLYYLVVRVRRKGTDESERKRLRQVHHRFDELNWMINSAGVTALGIQPSPQKRTSHAPNCRTKKGTQVLRLSCA